LQTTTRPPSDEPTAPTPEYQTPAPPGPKRWHAGTLTYTTAGLVVLFFWLLWGDFAYMLKERSVPSSLTVLLKKFGATDFLAALLVVSLPQIIAVSLTPIVSYKSDRHRGRWGRRIPFLLIPTPIAVLSMVGLAFSPFIGRWAHHVLGSASPGQTVFTLASFALFWTLFELCSIVCTAVFTALINDVVPRAVIGRFFGLFRVFSLGAGMTFTWYLFGKVDTHYVPIFLGIGLMYGLSFTAMCFNVKEGKYPPPEDVPRPTSVSGGTAWREEIALARLRLRERITARAVLALLWTLLPPAVRAYLRECFAHPYYRWYFLSIALANMAFTPVNTFYVYFAQSVGMSNATLGKYSTLQFACSLLLAYPIGVLADRIHPIRVTMIALALYAAATALSFFFVHDARMYGIAHVVCGAISGIWLTATSPLSPALLPRARFAQFISAMGICTAAGVGIISPACGMFLDYMDHEYRYIYVWGFTLMVLAFLATCVVYRKFMAYGGPRAYVAPE
jgi:Na+/melibiose symporter-like transporter